MESNFLFPLVDFVHILLDSSKIFLKNGKLMSFLILLIISFHSILNLANAFTIKPLLVDLTTKLSFLLFSTNSDTNEFFNLALGVFQDARLFLGAESLFILFGSIASFFFAIATTFAAAMTHGGKKISIKGLAATTIKSWKRPLTSYFYITLLCLGYGFLSFMILVPLNLILGFMGIIPRLILAVPFIFFYIYISVGWNLSFIVSILEEKAGIGALGKAGRIVEGVRVQGFVINLVAMILFMVLSQSWKLMSKEKAEVKMVVEIVVVNLISSLVRVFWYMGYTVMYFRCKKSSGEEVELPEVEYSKISSSSPLVVGDKNIP